MFRIVLSILSIFIAVATPLQAQTGILNLPPRPANAKTGTQFYNQINGISESAREQAIVNEFATGNVPNFLRTLKPITVTSGSNIATYFASLDYVAIGSDADFFRIPMSAPLAQQIADIAGCNLPTRKMVIDIHVAAEVRLTPSTFSPSTYQINTVPVFWLSNQSIETKRAGRPFGLIDGIKKDVVISPTTPTRPSPLRVCIVGWYYNSNTSIPAARTDSYIQPLSTVHENTYEDYSHGIRLIEHNLVVNGNTMTVDAVLSSPTYAALLSDEGSFTTTRYPIPNPYPLPTTLGPNLVVDGNFEGTYTNGVAAGWTKWQGAGSAALTFGRASVNKYDGLYSQYFSRGDSAVADGGVYQTVAVTAGKQYELQVAMKRQSTYTGSYLKYGADPNGGTNPAAASIVYKDITGGTDNVWISDKTTVTATGSTLTIFAKCGHTGTTPGANAYFYIDAISLRQIGP